MPDVGAQTSAPSVAIAELHSTRAVQTLHRRGADDQRSGAPRTQLDRRWIHSGQRDLNPYPGGRRWLARWRKR
jgi:hypothetical protein